ncbi:MAG: DUF268 domain-containing protein [Betaproteobacteria bacterium]
MFTEFFLNRRNGNSPIAPDATLLEGNEALRRTQSILRDRYQTLTAVRDELRKVALEQATKIDALKAFNMSAIIEQNSLHWRHYALCTELFGAPNTCTTPPREIPVDLMERYTMGGRVPIEYNYLDATYPDNWPLIYTDHEIDLYLDKIKRREYFIYGMTDVWMWQAIERFPIQGLHVVNMGSLTPWYEANCLYHGAKSTTVDYNRIIALTSRITTMTIGEYDQQRPLFDVAWSISSFEHDGLGMYGDPLDPEGDLKAMKKMKSMVKPGGLLFLSVPVGKDKILFNNARIYGRLRLPLLTQEWEELATFGLEPVHYDGPGHLQPVIILKNS